VSNDIEITLNDSVYIDMLRLLKIFLSEIRLTKRDLFYYLAV
jgi:hypothetical protein